MVLASLLDLQWVVVRGGRLGISSESSIMEKKAVLGVNVRMLRGIYVHERSTARRQRQEYSKGDKSKITGKADKENTE